MSPVVAQGPQAFGWSLDRTGYVFEKGDWHRYAGPVRMEVWGEATGLSQAALASRTPSEGRFRWDNRLLVYVHDSVEAGVFWNDVLGEYEWTGSPPVDSVVVPNPVRCDELLRDELDSSGRSISDASVRSAVLSVQASEPFDCGWDVWDPRSGTAGGGIGCYEAQDVGGQSVPYGMQKSYTNMFGNIIYYGVFDPTAQYSSGSIIHWRHEDKYAPAAGVGCWLKVGGSWSSFEPRSEVSAHIPVGLGGEEVTQFLPGSSDPFERVFYQGEDPVEDDPGGPRLVPIEGDPVGPTLLRVLKLDDERFELKFSTVPPAPPGVSSSKRPILYRHWAYDGGVAHLGNLRYPVRQLVLNPVNDDVGMISVRLADWQEQYGGAGPASGLYAFQLAYLNVETGGPEYWSNVGFQIVGYEQLPTLAPVNWSADYRNEVYHNAPTPVPTPEFGMSRPSAPVILRLESYGTDGWIGVFVGSPSVGRFEYRMWSYSGGRHLDGNVPWVEVALGGGDGGMFQVRVPLVENEAGVWVRHLDSLWAVEVRRIVRTAAYDNGVFLRWEELRSPGSNVETVLVWSDRPGVVPTPRPAP